LDEKLRIVFWREGIHKKNIINKNPPISGGYIFLAECCMKKLPPMREIMVPDILPELFTRIIHTDEHKKNPPKVRKLTEDLGSWIKQSTTQYHTVREWKDAKNEKYMES
jgi:hypothetical protein